MRKAIKISFAGASVIILSVFFLFLYASRNVEVNDKDLVYRPEKIDDEKNAYNVLLPILRDIKEQQLADKVELPEEDKSSFDYEAANRFLKEYSSFLSTLSRALEFDSFQVPQDEQFLTAKTERYLSEMFFLYNLEVLKIKVLLHNNKMNMAAEELLKLYKHGYLVQNSDGEVIYYLLGAWIKRMTLELMREWAIESHLDSDYYRAFITRAERHADNQALIMSLKIEYNHTATRLSSFLVSDLLETLKNNPEYEETYDKYKKNPGRMKYLYNANATINEVAKYYRQEIENAKGLYTDINRRDRYKPAYRFSKWYLMLSGNQIGKLLLAMVSPNFYSVVEKKFQLDAMHELTKLFLALRAYYADNENLPSTLDDLVPHYINTIPKDPFDNMNLKYSASDKVIYSSGFDMYKTQGKKNNDLSIELNF